MCDRCGATENIEVVGAMTAYDSPDGKPDPNHPIPYCPDCTEEYVDFWDEMWAEYYSGCL